MVLPFPWLWVWLSLWVWLVLGMVVHTAMQQRWQQQQPRRQTSMQRSPWQGGKAGPWHQMTEEETHRAAFLRLCGRCLRRPKETQGDCLKYRKRAQQNALCASLISDHTLTDHVCQIHLWSMEITCWLCQWCAMPCNSLHVPYRTKCGTSARSRKFVTLSVFRTLPGTMGKL